MSKTADGSPAIRAEPPTKENITNVAHDIRKYWGLGTYYCPVVCYEIRDGRMVLTRAYEIPDDGSGAKKLLFVVKGKHSGNRMSDYRADIYGELWRRGIGAKPPARTHLAKVAAAVRQAFEDGSRAHRELFVYRYVRNGRVRVEAYSEGGDRSSESMVFVCRLSNGYAACGKKRGGRRPTTAHYLEQIAAGLRAQGVDA